jgi:hypothetical protein
MLLKVTAMARTSSRSWSLLSPTISLRASLKTAAKETYKLREASQGTEANLLKLNLR